MSPPSSVSKNKSSSAYHLLSHWFLDLFFDPEDSGDVPPKRQLTFNGLQGVISQKTVLVNKQFTVFEKYIRSGAG
jgi:hypothetical protein